MTGRISTALASALDDILDLIDGCAQRLVMYNVENTTPEAKELAFLILKGAEAINKALHVMGGKLEPIAEYCVEVNALENEG